MHRTIPPDDLDLDALNAALREDMRRLKAEREALERVRAAPHVRAARKENEAAARRQAQAEREARKAQEEREADERARAALDLAPARGRLRPFFRR